MYIVFIISGFRCTGISRNCTLTKTFNAYSLLGLFPFHLLQLPSQNHSLDDRDMQFAYQYGSKVFGSIFVISGKDYLTLQF